MEETCGLIGQCSTKRSIKSPAQRRKGEDVGFPKQKYASLFFVCLFVCQKKILTGIV